MCVFDWTIFLWNTPYNALKCFFIFKGIVVHQIEFLNKVYTSRKMFSIWSQTGIWHEMPKVGQYATWSHKTYYFGYNYHFMTETILATIKTNFFSVKLIALKLFCFAWIFCSKLKNYVS